MNTETQNKITELIIAESMKELNNNINASLDEFKTGIEARIDGIKTAAYADIKTLESYITTEKPLVINLGSVEVPDKKLVHKSFQTIIKILSSTKRKEKNIMLVGGAGGGKTHLVGSIAEALKLPFYPMSVGLQTTKSDLLGFINANGIYMPSPIRLAYENGGVLLLDEFDAAHAGVITILNSLLANGHCSFPDKIVEKHKDFVCLCACNTYGKGGTMDYVGRNRLDAATLDRFIIVDVDYDENLEKTLTNHKEWTKIINKIRDNITKYGIKMIVSPRASMDGADLLDAGFTVEEVLEMCIFKGCDDDVKTKIKKGIEFGKVSTQQAVERPDWLTEPVDIDVAVNFDTLSYAITSRMSLSYDTTDIKISDKFKLSIYEKYEPYLNEYMLYLNPKKVKLNSAPCYNKSADINALKNDLKNMSSNFLTPSHRASIHLTIVFEKEVLTVNLNTGDYFEERIGRNRKRVK